MHSVLEYDCAELFNCFFFEAVADISIRNSGWAFKQAMLQDLQSSNQESREMDIIVLKKLYVD